MKREPHFKTFQLNGRVPCLAYLTFKGDETEMRLCVWPARQALYTYTINGVADSIEKMFADLSIVSLNNIFNDWIKPGIQGADKFNHFFKRFTMADGNEVLTYYESHGPDYMKTRRQCPSTIHHLIMCEPGVVGDVQASHPKEDLYAKHCDLEVDKVQNIYDTMMEAHRALMEEDENDDMPV